MIGRNYLVNLRQIFQRGNYECRRWYQYNSMSSQKRPNGEDPPKILITGKFAIISDIWLICSNVCDIMFLDYAVALIQISQVA